MTLDTRDLESRLKQTFPGADVHVRQVGMQVILEGQVPDSKTMSEVLQLVTAELRGSGSLGMGGSSGSSGMGGPAGGQNAGTGGGQPAGMAPEARARGWRRRPGRGDGRRAGPAAMGGASGGAGASSSAQGVSIINRVNVPGPRQVLLKVKIAELNRTAIRELGISWLNTRNNAILGSTIGNAAIDHGAAGGPSIDQTELLRVLHPRGIHAGGQLGRRGSSSPSPRRSTRRARPINANAQLFGIFNAGQFSLFLNALRSNSLAKILAEPTLMTLDGQPARFLAGGQFPYPVPQSAAIHGGRGGRHRPVQGLRRDPLVPAQHPRQRRDPPRRRADLQPAQLRPGDDHQRRARSRHHPSAVRRTVVELREGQTLAIAGLLQTTTNASTVRVPGLGDLPIVGPWFSSNRIETVETELVVLVTPELVAPMEAKEVPPARGSGPRAERLRVLLPGPDRGEDRP